MSIEKLKKTPFFSDAVGWPRSKTSLFHTSLPSKRLTELTRLGNAHRCSRSAMAMPVSSILARADWTCVEQRGLRPGPPDHADVNDDGNVGMVDFAAFQVVFTGP